MSYFRLDHLPAINTTQAFGSPCFRAPPAPPVKHCHLVGNKCLTGRGAICLSQAFFSSGLRLHKSLCGIRFDGIFLIFFINFFFCFYFYFYCILITTKNSSNLCLPIMFPEAQTCQNKCCVLIQPVIDIVTLSKS